MSKVIYCPYYEGEREKYVACEDGRRCGMKENISEIMNIGQAFAIFKQIKSDKYSNGQKSMAIYLIIHCETINGITKSELLCALEWLYDNKVKNMSERTVSKNEH